MIFLLLFSLLSLIPFGYSYPTQSTTNNDTILPSNSNATTHNTLATNSTSNIPTTDKNSLKHLHLNNLPDHIHDILLDKIYPNATILTLKQTSKYWRDFLNERNYGSFSKIGSPDNILDRTQTELCQRLTKNPDLYAQIKSLYVTTDLWEQCQFAPEKLINLRELYLMDVRGSVALVSNAQTSVPKYNVPTVDLWEEIRLKFGKLKKLEVFDATRTNIVHKILTHQKFDNTDRFKLVKSKFDTGLLDFEFMTKDGHSFLHYCLLPDLFRITPSSYFNTTECLNYFIDHGVKPNTFSVHGYSPVHFASALAYSEPLAVILKNGGDINHRMPSDNLVTEAPIHVAFRYTYPKTPTLENRIELASYMARIIPFHHQVLGNGYESHWKQKEGILEPDRPSKTILPFKFLVEHGANLIAPSELFVTVLNQAIVENDARHVVKFLLNRRDLSKTLLETTDIKGNTPLMLSILYAENEDIALQLIEKGSNINAVNSFGNSPLWMAFEKQMLNVAEILLEKGANSNILDFQFGERNIVQTFFRFPVGIENALKRSFHIFKVLIQHDLDFKRRDRNGVSAFRLFLVHILHSIHNSMAVQESKSFLEMLSEHFPVDGFFEPSHPLDRVDAHYFIITAYSTNDQHLIDQVLQKIPRVIREDLASNGFSKENGLQFSDTFQKTKGHEIYQHLHDFKPTQEIFFQMLYSSPSILPMLTELTLPQNLFFLIHESNFRNLVKMTVRVGSFMVAHDMFRTIQRANHVRQEMLRNNKQDSFLWIETSAGVSFLKDVLEDALLNQDFTNLNAFSPILFKELVNVVDQSGDAPLHWCTYRVHDSTLCLSTLLNKGANVDSKNINGMTPFHLSILHGQAQSIDLLLNSGANPLEKTSSDALKQSNQPLSFFSLSTVLHLLVFAENGGSHFDRKKIGSEWIRRGGSVNETDAFGITSLRYAVLTQDMEWMKFILDVDSRSMFIRGLDGRTVLWDALMTGHEGILRLLLETLSDQFGSAYQSELLDLKDVYGNTIKEYALCPYFSSNVKMLIWIPEVDVKRRSREKCDLLNPIAVEIQKPKETEEDTMRLSSLILSNKAAELTDVTKKWEYISQARLADIRNFGVHTPFAEFIRQIVFS